MEPLFPVPRQVVVIDPGARTTGPVEHAVDADLPAQGYELRVGDGRARLTYADEAGRRYGEQTVEQLRDAGGALPAVHVRDWPDFAVRGFMLDVSRDRVPTRATLERLVRILARCRYNHLQLYVEHTFAYVGHEAVWRDASPLTADDLAWLDSLCADHGLELVANQNCFGHMGRWLSHEEHRWRAECPNGVEVAPGLRWPPSVLAPTPANADFALSLVREQMAALRSRTVNIGCDETFELGRGASSARVAEEGLAAVYLEHLHRIAAPLLEDGCSVQAWGDVIAHHPGAVERLPAGDLTALVWNYDAPGAPTPALRPRVAAMLQELGIDLTTPTDFATRLAPFVAADVPTWVVPGTSGWQSLVGRWDNARANLLDAARAGVDAGACVTGYLVTDWGDNGHHQPPAVSDPAIVYGGAVSWCSDTNAGLDVAGAIDRHVAGDDSGTIGRVLEAVGSVGSRTGVVARNVSPIFAALFPHQAHLTSGTADPDAVSEVLTELEVARSDLGAARPTVADGATVVDEIDVAIGLAHHGATRMAAAVGGADPGPDAMRADLADLIGRYRSTWAARSRPGGLADSVAHLERTLATY